MPSVDRNTMTDNSSGHRCCNCGLNLRNSLQFISSLLLPLMLGVFTIVITIHQQRVASIQRTQDLNNSAQQRAEDRQMALEQRAQDKLIAREQREQDELRRVQDLKIAEDKRDQDNILAEKERDMLEKQRIHELSVEAARYEKETEKYLDALLVTYMNEIGTLFLNNNGSLTSDPRIATLVRLKTLTILRQLDPSRNTQLIQFLYEAGQLTNGENPLDLSGANFNGINFSGGIQNKPMHRLCLFGTYLNNASFYRIDLTYANFSKTQMKNASFVDTYIERADFSYAVLLGVHFEKTNIFYTNYANANMMNTKFTYVAVSFSQFTHTRMAEIIMQNRNSFYYCNLTDVNDLSNTNFSQIGFGYVQLINVNLYNAIFTGASMRGTSFINTMLHESDFSRIVGEELYFKSCSMNNITFVNASLRDTIWSRNDLVNVDFTNAKLESASFIDVKTLENVSFVRTYAQGINLTQTTIKFSNFSYCQCSHGIFIQTIMSNVSFNEAELKNANFSDSVISSDVNFFKIDGSEAVFSLCGAYGTNFSQSKLINANFAWCDATSADFSGTDVNGIDFSYASLSDARITQEQLDRAMSISGTIFQKKIHRNPNLLMNNGNECNTTAAINSTFWQVKPSEAVILVTPNNDTTCTFIVNQSAIMSQTIDVSRYRRLIDRGRARYDIYTNIWNDSVIFYVTIFTSTGFSYNHSFYEPKTSGFQLLEPIFSLPQGTIRLLLSIVFEKKTSRCGYIDLSIQDRDVDVHIYSNELH